MSKVAHYLQEHLVGEVMSSPDARQYFSTDASILSIPPALVVYPRNENDVRKTARFSWQLAERGRPVPITPRGLGTDLSGASLGSGIMLVFPAHMNRIIDFDGKTGDVTVEPGTNYGKLQQALNTHYRFLPCYPASLEYSTIGGAIANNASGEMSLKYGSTRGYVKRLRVVLANGEVIETKRLSKRELNKKLGLSSFEGEIYRQLDALIEENNELIEKSVLTVTKNSSGYELASVKNRDGSFDLTPLLVGSQGTLGIVTEATLTTEQYNPRPTLIVAFCDDISQAGDIISTLANHKNPPSSIEMVDDKLLDFVNSQHPTLLSSIVQPPFQKVNLFIEYDSLSSRTQKRSVKRATKILNKMDIIHQVETDADAREKLLKIRGSASSYLAHFSGSARPLPFMEDGIVPVERFADYVQEIYNMCNAAGVKPTLWGHAGNANLHIQPVLDLSQVGDRQKMLKLMDDYNNMVIEMGGSVSAEHGDGRVKAPYLPNLFGSEVYKLFQNVKRIFDPHGIMNPGVKIDVTMEDIRPHIREEYGLSHFYDHLPRS